MGDRQRILLEHQEGKGVGILGVGDTQRGPLPCRLLLSGTSFPLPPSSEPPLVPLIVPANATPHPRHSHTLPCSGRDTSSYPLAPAPPLPRREGYSSHTALFAAMRAPPPPAMSQGRAQCPLYMRLHEASAGASLSPQTPN